jgi:hypothetical protein
MSRKEIGRRRRAGKIVLMSRTWCALLLGNIAALGLALAGAVGPSSQETESWHGVLDEHPAIQYAARPTSDRVASLQTAIARSQRSLRRDPTTGYLTGVLDALGLSTASQLLVFSKTGVQRAYTSPHTPRAIYFDQSVAVAYVPDAPLLEIAAHDPQQGVVFYTLEQGGAAPVLTRQRSCLTCHVSATTLDVPGMIARSNTIDEDGNIMPQTGSQNVNHQTPHPDRWGGWFVTSEDAAPPYAQMAHRGNITFSGRGNTSNQVFVDWLNSTPEAHGYLSRSSDIVALLVFDHQMHAINLLTRLNWESRVAASRGEVPTSAGAVRQLAAELADYLLFADEAPPLAPLTPPPAFAASLAARTPQDRLGRSFAQLDMVNRLLRYPCSYMVYSEAFDSLPKPVRAAVYQRMLKVLSGEAASAHVRQTAADRRAVLEILRETKPDFPRD